MSSDEQRRKQRDDQEHQQHQQHQQQHPEHKDGQTLGAAAQRSSSSASSTPLSPGTTTQVDGSSRPQEAYARRDAEVGGRPTMPPSKPDTIPLATLSALLPLSGEEGVDCDGDSRSPLSSHGSAGLKPVPTLAHRQHASKGQRDDRSRGATNISRNSAKDAEQQEQQGEKKAKLSNDPSLEGSKPGALPRPLKSSPTVVDAAAQRMKALGLVALGGMVNVKCFDGICLELSRACREGGPWAVKLGHKGMPQRMQLLFSSVSGQPAKQSPRNRLVQRLRIKSVSIMKEYKGFHQTGFSWPKGVEQLHFKTYNVDLNSISLPHTLVKIKLQSRAGKPPSVERVIWPKSLRVLELLQLKFNTPVENMVLPAGLQEITLGGAFNQPIAGVEWPSELVRVSIVSSSFCQSLVGVKWPPLLQDILVGGEYDEPFAGVKWPPQLRVLKLNECFNGPLDGVAWPDTLRELSFLVDEYGVGYFDQPIDVSPLPRDLEILKFGDQFDQRFDRVQWPQGLKEIVLGHNFRGGNGSNLRHVRWPASLRDITAPLAALTALISDAKTMMSKSEQRRHKIRVERKMHHDACTKCAGRRELQRIEEFRELGWVPKECRIHDAYSPMQKEQGLRDFGDSCNEHSSDDEADERAEKEFLEAYNYDAGWWR